MTTPWEDVDERCELAYVQWYKTAPRVEAVTQMFKVSLTTSFDVVDIDTLERGAHLIPAFGKAMNTPMADASSRPALDEYKDFWLNNQIDPHMYNTIYA
jgi:hypothetical protein